MDNKTFSWGVPTPTGGEFHYCNGSHIEVHKVGRSEWKHKWSTTPRASNFWPTMRIFIIWQARGFGACENWCTLWAPVATHTTRRHTQMSLSRLDPALAYDKGIFTHLHTCPYLPRFPTVRGGMPPPLALISTPQHMFQRPQNLCTCVIS